MTGARVPEGTVAVVPVERTDASPTGPAPARVDRRRRPDARSARARAGEDVTAGSCRRRSGIRDHGGAHRAGPLRGLHGRRGPRAHRGWRSSRPEPSWRHPTPTRASAASTSPTPTWSQRSLRPPAATCVASRCAPTSPTSCATCSTRSTPTPHVDLVITTGGVSAGAYEVVRQVCEPLPTFDFVHLAMQPGGPQGLGRYGSTPVVCLPGTPVGAFVAFEVLVRPALDRRHGAPPTRPGHAAYRGKPRRTRAGRVQFVTSVLHDDGTVTAPGRAAPDGARRRELPHRGAGGRRPAHRRRRRRRAPALTVAEGARRRA